MLSNVLKAVYSKPTKIEIIVVDDGSQTDP